MLLPPGQLTDQPDRTEDGMPVATDAEPEYGRQTMALDGGRDTMAVRRTMPQRAG